MFPKTALPKLGNHMSTSAGAFRLRRKEIKSQDSKMALAEAMAKMGGQETDIEFVKKMDQVIEHNSLGIAVAIGHRLGLFKTMVELTEPKTSSEIAEKSGLNERYVREWLAIMVTSRVFTIDKESNTYFLPRNRVPYFENVIGKLLFEEFFIMFPPVLGELEQCFRKGGGVPYSSYAGFHEVMNGMSAQGHKANLLQNHIPSIKGLHEKLESGILCLDVGCGMGSPGLLMGKRYPKSEMYGLDFSEHAIKAANQEAEAMGLKNTHFIQQDVAMFDPKYAEMFDYISANDAIHDQAKPADVLSNIYKMLKKGGIFSMVDIDAHSHPADNIGKVNATLKYSISLLHCMPVSLFFEGGAGLGTCWGRELAVQMLKDAGFVDIGIQPYPGDFNVHYISKKE